MKDRMIGSVGWFIILLVAFIFNMLDVLFLGFLVVGLYEIIKMYRTKATKFAFVYAFIFTMGIISLISLYNYNNVILLFLIINVMMCDSFAYIVGKNFGKHHFSKISPNKTIEGLVGGIGITLVVDMILVNAVTYFSNVISINNLVLVIIMAIILVFSIIGDLLESKLKRTTGVKDSGNIVYGHGGICDRIDSWVLAAIPAALFILVLS